jgi:hypothetical protein
VKIRQVLSGLAMTFALVVACTGCSQGSATSENGEATSSAATGSGLPAGFVLASMPAEVRSVGETKGNVQKGDEVAIRGRIGGSAEPFVEGRAAFTMVDNKLKACSDIPGDLCPMPWDYCCEPRDSLAQHSATVRVVNADGSPASIDLREVTGIKELSDIVVVGTVEQAEGAVLLVHARGIYIAKP